MAIKCSDFSQLPIVQVLVKLFVSFHPRFQECLYFSRTKFFYGQKEQKCYGFANSVNGRLV